MTPRSETLAPFAGLELLASAVIILDGRLRVTHINAAAENTLAVPRKTALGHSFLQLFMNQNGFSEKLLLTLEDGRGFWDPMLSLTRVSGESLSLSCLVTPLDIPQGRLLLELRAIDQHLRIEREAQAISQNQANRELIRNLAHEIKNPLGGLRGSAQLLDHELDERPDLREYTQVIIKEADRLQSLMERMLTPSRLPQLGAVNIHEVCERVRTLVLAEFPAREQGGLRIWRDYDTSLPEVWGDREQLIQAVLNITRNAAQALAGSPPPGGGDIRLQTRVARHASFARGASRLALELQVIDNGPGIAEAIRERIFHPLVSGREGGTGLGLTLAQTFVQYHHGVIECESRPGKTTFRIVLPIDDSIVRNH